MALFCFNYSLKTFHLRIPIAFSIPLCRGGVKIFHKTDIKSLKNPQLAQIICVERGKWGKTTCNFFLITKFTYNSHCFSWGEHKIFVKSLTGPNNSYLRGTGEKKLHIIFFLITKFTYNMIKNKKFRGAYAPPRPNVSPPLPLCITLIKNNNPFGI